jgi:excisionase family DNA binding protein
MDGRWLAITEAAAYARISRSGLYKFIAAGRLKVYKLGSRTLIRSADLDALIESGTAPAVKAGNP